MSLFGRILLAVPPVVVGATVVGSDVGVLVESQPMEKVAVRVKERNDADLLIVEFSGS
jgi:hypothetical protein